MAKRLGLKMDCSICVATYKRPELLSKLLESIKNQELIESISYEIIVVDNDPDESAKEVVLGFKDVFGDSISYYMQPEKNISLTRNLAVAEAKGFYLLFIDDDEVADSKWIQTLYKTIKEYKVDAVFGRVQSYYDEDTPDWIKKCYIYNRPSPPTGTEAHFTRTGNCIIKSKLLKETDGPFDINYGISGGSDTHLFGKLKNEGAKYINCHEAVTYEYVPPERTKFNWIIKRAFRGGNDYTRHAIELANKKQKIFVRTKHMIIAIIYVIISFCLSIIFLPSKVIGMHWRLKMMANLGKLYAILGFFPKEYQ